MCPARRNALALYLKTENTTQTMAFIDMANEISDKTESPPLVEAKIWQPDSIGVMGTIMKVAPDLAIEGEEIRNNRKIKYTFKFNE